MNININTSNYNVKHPLFGEIEGLIGGYVVNTCFHPDEFPIGAYRYTSIATTITEADTHGLEPLFASYDTLSNGGMKGFPNIVLKNRGTLFKLIIQVINSNKTLATRIRETRELVYGAIQQSGINNKGPQSNILTYLVKLFQDLGLYDEIVSFFGNENKANKFIFLLLKPYFQEGIQNIHKKTEEALLCPQYKDGEIELVDLNLAVQNAILDIISDKEGDIETQSVIKSGISLDSSLLDWNNKMTQSMLLVIENDTLGFEFLRKYLNNIGNSNIHLATIAKVQGLFFSNGQFILKDSDGISKVISEDEVLELFRENPCQITWKGCISILLYCLGGTRHIGSERGYREIVATTLSEYPEVISEAGINEIMGNAICDTYVENDVSSTKKLAGSAGITPSDLLSHCFLPDSYTSYQLKMARRDLSIHIGPDTYQILSGFLSDLEVKFPDIAEKNTGLKATYLDNPCINNFIPYALSFLGRI